MDNLTQGAGEREAFVRSQPASLGTSSDSVSLSRYARREGARFQRVLRAERTARGIGWLSVGLGMVSLLAPHMSARSIGVRDRPMLFRAIGVREIVIGVGLLANEKPAGWLWSRVGGDAMDLALLGMAARDHYTDRTRLRYASMAAAGCAAADVYAAWNQQVVQQGARAGLVRVEKAVTIDRTPDEVYQFWRKFENFPRFMHNIASITELGGRRSHWVAKGPGGSSIEWDAEITIDQPGQMLAWRSLEDADITNFGSVRFEPLQGGRATSLHVEMHYRPPAGRLGAMLARLMGRDPGREMDADLQRLKSLLNTGQTLH